MGSPSSKTYYVVLPNLDITKVATEGQNVTGAVFSSEEGALTYANRRTAASGDYKSTITVATKLVAPKPVEMVQQDLAAC